MPHTKGEQYRFLFILARKAVISFIKTLKSGFSEVGWKRQTANHAMLHFLLPLPHSGHPNFFTSLKKYKSLHNKIWVLYVNFPPFPHYGKFFKNCDFFAILPKYAHSPAMKIKAVTTPPIQNSRFAAYKASSWSARQCQYVLVSISIRDLMVYNRCVILYYTWHYVSSSHSPNYHFIHKTYFCQQATNFN